MWAASRRELRLLGEALAVILVLWIALGWFFGHPITQVDGSMFLQPYTRSQLDAGPAWTDHLYRFGVLGGSPMHPYAGTLPLVQLCAALGLGATTTVNIGTMFLQLCFAFFGMTAIESLVARWSQRTVMLTAPERLISISLCAFAPLLGWRLSIGHENLLQGLLPFAVATSLLWAAAARRLGPVSLVLGCFAAWNGLSGLGAQLVIYSLVFGAPILFAVLWSTRPWTRQHAAVVAVIVAGLLFALPRVACMLAYATSDDASRALGTSVVSAPGTGMSTTDWLLSLTWSFDRGVPGPHEHNYPLGPLLAFVVLVWPWKRARPLAIGVALSLVLAILFTIVPSPLTTLAPPLGSFRIPARALMPVVLLLPPLALACWFTVRPEPTGNIRTGWIAIVAMLGLVALHGVIPPLAIEIAAWIACTGLAVLARLGSPLLARHALWVALAVVAAGGTYAFDARFPRGIPSDRIEDGPQQVRTAALAQAPELANPLNRVVFAAAPPPFRVGLAFAAGLGSLDGDFNPPRRFLQLVSLLVGRDLPATIVLFELGRSPVFPILQQLYNVRYEIDLRRQSIHPLAETPGAAWLPERVEVAGDPAEVASALETHVGTLGRTAWVTKDAGVGALTCSGTVSKVTTDRRGQDATITLTAASDCLLVVATTDVALLRARVSVGQQVLDVSPVPVDIALTGIPVPAGTTQVTLGPVTSTPAWSWPVIVIGIVLAGLALAGCRRSFA